jgi:hypothetical protein
MYQKEKANLTTKYYQNQASNTNSFIQKKNNSTLQDWNYKKDLQVPLQIRDPVLKLTLHCIQEAVLTRQIVSDLLCQHPAITCKPNISQCHCRIYERGVSFKAKSIRWYKLLIPVIAMENVIAIQTLREAKSYCKRGRYGW